MKQMVLLVSLCLLSFVSCRSNSFDLSKVRWAPTFEDVGRLHDIKMLIFLYDFDYNDDQQVKDCTEFARITDPEKIERVRVAISHSQRDTLPEGCLGTKMAVIDEKNQGLILNFCWDDKSKKVEFTCGYSEELYDLLVEYGVIRQRD
ncbi:MAG TPA: hypothetical protein VJJ98_05560 [Sedimentisphaerales bacterium]|nr:hypothetical protein [Sedimentisphaerales bacterium]